MCCGSRSQLQSAAAQLVQAGTLALLITCCSRVADHTHRQLMCTFSFFTVFVWLVKTQAGLRWADAQCNATETWVAVAGVLSNLASTQKHVSLCLRVSPPPQAVKFAGAHQGN